MTRDDTDKFVHTKRHFGNDPNFFKQGVYPYEYVTEPEILTETCLPPREIIYSEFNEESISEEQYDRALETWRRYDCKTLKDYHDLFLTLYVTLLADVFDNFRNMALREYKLDPAHCWTVPGFAWNCALKMSKIELELITEPTHFSSSKIPFAEGFPLSVIVMPKATTNLSQSTVQIYLVSS